MTSSSMNSEHSPSTGSGYNPEEIVKRAKEVSREIVPKMLQHFRNHMVEHNLDPLSAAYIACEILCHTIGYCDWVLREGMVEILTPKILQEYEEDVDQLVRACLSQIRNIRKGL